MEEKRVDVCERLNVCVCAWYKEGRWSGSGIIWRGRCLNILSWITALYTGEMDGQTTDRRLEGGREGRKRRTKKKRRRQMIEGKWEINRATRFSRKPYLEERKRAAKHFLGGENCFRVDIFLSALKACWSFVIAAWNQCEINRQQR